MNAPPCGGVNVTGYGCHVDPRDRNRWPRARHVSSRTDLPAPRHPDQPRGSGAGPGGPSFPSTTTSTTNTKEIQR